ncbi:MAG: phosphoadenosine phosphosulfate reductase family protein, partial [Ureaplasma sp.]|nr:phosphoadenosine phosphosulfate reductase family protein [Ureaplasma sp.]
MLDKSNLLSYNLNHNLQNININQQDKLDRKSHCDELINITKYEDKLKIAKIRIKEFLLFCNQKFINLKTPKSEREIILSFSGGKDSTVLLDLVVKVFQEMLDQNEIEMMYLVPSYAFEITFPETFSFIKSITQNYQQEFVKEVYLAKPKYPWNTILKEFGYPIYSKQISVLLHRITNVKSKNGLTNWIFGINTTRYKLSRHRLFLLDKRMRDWSKYEFGNKEYFGETLNEKYYFFSEKCCNHIKGGLKRIKKPSLVGTMASESQLRKQSWINHGCNVITKNHELSRPLSIFNSSDIWRYIFENNIRFNPKYGNFNSKINEIKNICKTCSSSREKNKKIMDSIQNNMKYSRLGCISCPYGSHLEDKEKRNRFETLLLESEMLYKAQVIDNGMYKILIDMNIKLNEYNRFDIFSTSKEKYDYHKLMYEKLFEIRQKHIEE